MWNPTQQVAPLTTTSPSLQAKCRVKRKAKSKAAGTSGGAKQEQGRPAPAAACRSNAGSKTGEVKGLQVECPQVKCQVNDRRGQRQVGSKQAAPQTRESGQPQRAADWTLAGARKVVPSLVGPVLCFVPPPPYLRSRGSHAPPCRGALVARLQPTRRRSPHNRSGYYRVCGNATTYCRARGTWHRSAALGATHCSGPSFLRMWGPQAPLRRTGRWNATHTQALTVWQEVLGTEARSG